MSNTEPARLAYTIDETAELLGVSRSTVYRMVENGSLPYKRISGAGKGAKGRMIIPAHGLNKWLSCPDEPRQAAFEKKAREIVKSAGTKLRKAR